MLDNCSCTKNSKDSTDKKDQDCRSTTKYIVVKNLLVRYTDEMSEMAVKLFCTIRTLGAEEPF